MGLLKYKKKPGWKIALACKCKKVQSLKSSCLLCKYDVV